MTCALYRHFDADGALLYVGVTNHPKRRLSEHKCRAVWADQIADVTVKWMACREDALAAEVEAIMVEGPVFNGRRAGRFEPTGDALKDWMNQTFTTQADLADAFGLTQASVSRLLSKKNAASLAFAVFVEDLTDGAVPVRYWLHSSDTEAPTPAQEATP